jgi:hypothetical protein
VGVNSITLVCFALIAWSMSSSLIANPWSASSEVTASLTRSPLLTLIVFGLNSNPRAVTLISRGSGSLTGFATLTAENNKTASGIVILTKVFLVGFIFAKLLDINGVRLDFGECRRAEYKLPLNRFPTLA